jgi:hypothetical protein
MTTVALVVAGISLICSGVSVVAVLVLLGRKEFAYATKADLERLADEVTYKMGAQGNSLSRVYRYVEALDEHLGANGHRVLGIWVPGQDSKDAHR